MQEKLQQNTRFLWQITKKIATNYKKNCGEIQLLLQRITKKVTAIYKISCGEMQNF